DFVTPFTETSGDMAWYFGRVGTMLDMLKMAAEQAKSTDPTKVAFALEGLGVKTPFGAATMRAMDHQLLQPLFISMLTKDVKYDAEKSGLGFKTIAAAMAEETAAPTSCQMKRPKR